MHNKGIIDKTLHFLVHNSFMFTVAIMGVVHLVLLAIMIMGGVTPLIYFNLVSVIIYIFSLAINLFYHAKIKYIKKY